MNRRITILCIALFFVVMIVIGVISNPLMRTQSAIHRRLLHLTPIGTNIEEVIRVAEGNSDWRVMSIREDVGVPGHFVRSSSVRDMYEHISSADFIGEQSVSVHLGSSAMTDVVAYYAFDKDGKLIEVFIRRTIRL